MKEKEFDLIKIILDKHIINNNIKENILKDISILVDKENHLNIPNKEIIKR